MTFSNSGVVALCSHLRSDDGVGCFDADAIRLPLRSFRSDGGVGCFDAELLDATFFLAGVALACAGGESALRFAGLFLCSIASITLPGRAHGALPG